MYILKFHLNLVSIFKVSSGILTVKFVVLILFSIFSGFRFEVKSNQNVIRLSYVSAKNNSLYSESIFIIAVFFTLGFLAFDIRFLKSFNFVFT